MQETPNFILKICPSDFVPRPISVFRNGKDISDHELTLLMQRYYNSETAGINYVVGTTQFEPAIFPNLAFN